MARVKYNKKFPLVITSDDMGKTELTNNWAAVNGYPVINDWIDLGIQPGGTKFLQAPYKKYYMQGRSSSVSNYQPMTYTDNVGKTQRYRITSAVMPYDLASNNYAKITADDAKLMLRTGWSFAQHDVNNTSSVDAISTAMTTNSTTWENQVGIGLKVMVEPNGNHNYLAAGKQNSGVCWNIFQNPTSEYLGNSKTITDWTNGTMPTTFSSKPTGGYTRTFFQGNESAWKSEVEGADGTKIIIGGTHGIGDEIKTHLRTATNVTQNAWVGSADEVWEYYFIYNNVKIGEATFADGKLTFDVQVPTYSKHQYRELTINIPGLTGTGAPSFSGTDASKVVTGGYNTSGGTGIGYTLNIGLESSINTYIDQLMTIYRDDQTNEFVKRDIEYLISQLWNGSSYTTSLNASPTYDLTVQSSLGTPLATIKTDTNGSKSFAVPRYILNGTTLYETTAAASTPKYAKAITTSSNPADIDYTEKSLTSLQVDDYTPKAVLLVEGEDMDGMTILGADLDMAQSSDGRYWAMALGSNGMAGNLVSGSTATVTSALPRGKYKAVIGLGETYKSQGTYNYNLLVDGTQVATVSTSSVSNNAVTELTTAQFDVVTNNLPITLTTDNTNAGSRWIDYIYFVQTGSLDPQVPLVSLTASAGITASILKGNSITITATATQRGGSNFTGTAIYQCSDNTGTADGTAKATSATATATYVFTPDAAGTYYFKAVATDGTLGDGTSDVITLTVVDAIDNYTLNIIDKSGNVAMTTTVSSGSLIADPLPNAYRSPFAENYKYYNTLAEAQANSGSNITSVEGFTQATVYVGYDVKTSDFNSSKKFAIYNASNKYFHAVYRTPESHTYNNLWWMRGENLDAQNGNDGISAAKLAFVDNSYMWYLGNDPYNIKIQNVGSGRYIDQSNSGNYYRLEHLATSEANATTYSIVYYGGNTTAGYYALYHRAQDKYIYYNGDNDGGWRLDPQRDAGKLKIVALPSLNINVVNGSGDVEATLHCYYKSGAAMPTFTPYFLTRAYTSNVRYYYDAACTEVITADGSTAVDDSKILLSDYNVYLKYDLDSSWNTDGLFKVSDSSTQHWYAIRFCNTNNYLNAGTTGTHDIGSAGSNAETSTTANNSHWAIYGSPYALRLVNRDAANNGLYAGIDMSLTGSSGAKARMSAESNDVCTVWEMRVVNNTSISNTSYRSQPGLNPFGSFSGEAPYFFLYANSSSLNPTDNQNCRVLQYDYKATTHSGPPTVTLTASPTELYAGSPITLTATPTLGGGSSLSNLQFYKKVDDGEWTLIGALTQATPTSETAYEKTFTPDVAGTYSFKATVSDNNSDTGTSDEVNVTVTAAPTLSTVTLSSSSSSNPVAGSTVTLTATATPATGYTVASLVIEKKNTSTDEWEAVEDASYTASAPSLGSAVRRASTVDPSTGEVTVTYDFTAGAVGTDYEFRANATFSNGNTTATVLSTDAVASGGENQSLQLTSSLPTPTLDNYTLHIIDNEGNDVFGGFSVTRQQIIDNNGDPLLEVYPQYASPFVSQYLYFDTSAEAQANSGSATTWSNTDVYVGYTVNATKMSADKVYAIWANSRYMHSVEGTSKSANGGLTYQYHNVYVINNQKWDVTDIGGNTEYVKNEVSTSNLPFIDNTYMWKLGTDPYNVVIENKANSGVIKTAYNNNPTFHDITEISNANHYCILYWQDRESNSAVETYASYYRVYDRTTSTKTNLLYNDTGNHYLACSSDGDYQWRSVDREHSSYSTITKVYITELPSVNINILNEGGEVESTLQGYLNSSASMPNFTPFFLYRVYTSGHTFYYNQEQTNQITGTPNASTIAENGGNVYVTYTLNKSKWLGGDAITTADTYYIKPADNDNYYWYMMRSNGNDGYALRADAESSLPAIVNRSNEARTTITSDPTSDVSKRSQWSFIGTPYNVKIVNRYYGSSGYLGIADDCAAGARFSVYDRNATSVLTSWEVMSGLASSPKLFFRPQGSYGGETPHLYFGWDGGATRTGMTIAAGGNQAYDFTYIATTQREHPSTVHLAASNETPYVDDPVTLTATATPDNKEANNVTYLVIEQETSTGVWTPVSAVYDNADVTNATKNASTGVVTVTYTFTPDAAGTYNFRAHAVIDDVNQYSTDASSVGGDGSALAITATVETITVNSDYYTLILVDKSGNQLFTETNVRASRVSEPNSISGRNGDPLANDWRSPLVARYYYYANATDAQNNSGSNLFDWSSTDATPTVYVGYSINPDYDLDGSENRDVDGKTYLLKFAGGESFCQENADGFEDTAKAGIYPYINGEGGLFVYGEDKLNATKSGAASTRTRWVWYLEGGDPYRLKISSLQTNTDGKGADHYSYLRTYKPQGYGSVVTGAIPKNATIYDGTDGGDPTGSHNARHVPTEYMVLYGSTTSYMKLVTTEVVDDGDGDTSNDVRQTVTSFENHWKNNPTAANVIAANDNTFSVGTEPTDAQKTAALVTGKGWHTYNAWAYASTWTSSSKTFDYAEHWYKTVGVGTEVSGAFNGDFTLEEEEVEGALILLDQHGWEVMRKPITKTGNSKKTAYANAIKVYDSPMVSTYHFWTNFSKASGYHKYVPTRNATKASNNATHQGTGTSLADYPEKTSNGTLLDIYVTYEVRDEYRNSYTGAATESATAASQFLIRMGTQYAKDNGGTTVTGDTEANNATAWKLHPNFNIDAEMDYKYSGTYSELTQDETEAAYLADDDPAVYDTKYGRNGFDPYNLQIESATNAGKLFTTNATSAANDGTGGIVSTYADENVMTVTLATYNSSGTAMTDYWDIGTGYSIPKPSNQTFMAVQDANGNMRLMPRFDHAHVIEGFTVLATPAAAQPANDESHSQTTLLTTGTITYHIIDNSGTDVFGAQTYTGPGFDIEKIYQSPMVEQYYYHASLTDAQDADKRGKADKTSFSLNDEVWISYKVKDDFNASKAYNIYGSGNYMHAVYRYGQSEDNPSRYAYLWWMQNQTLDRDGGNTISTTTFPFLDNTYAWQVGDNPDPYNVKFLNKGARRYLNQQATVNDCRMDELAIITTAGEVPSNATPFSILYYDDSSDDCTLYNRTHNKYVYNNGSDWRANASRTGDNRRLTITELPAININVVNEADEVECTLEGYYKSGCTWNNGFTPFYLQRIYTSNHQFYYTLENAVAEEDAITGTVDDTKVTSAGAVYVRYDLSADWGAATDAADLTAKHTAQTIKVIPSPTNDKINWYAVRTNNSKYVGASTTATPANLAEASSTNATTDADNDANKLAQWAFIGTPYNLKLVDRYHGTSNYLGISEAATAGSFAFIDDGTADITTWEVCTGYSSNNKLLIRPQRSLNGETPYLYIGWNGGRNNMSLAASTGGNYGLDLTWVKETDAKKVTFKLYDRNGNYMAETANGAIADVVIDGVSIGDALSAIFGHTNLERRYCEYSFYHAYDVSSKALSDERNVTGSELDETVYVQWDYTDDAPVFNEGVENSRDYQYYMMGVGSGSYYTLMDVEESSGTYTFKPMDGVVTPRDQAHQFAIVGNPYKFYLYNRGAEKNIRRKASLDLTFEDTEDDGTTPTEELEFDMPIVSTLTYSSTECSFRSKKSGRFLTVSNNAFTMAATSSPTQKTRFRYIIVPVRVFKEGATTWTSDAENDQKDYRMYGLEMNPTVSGTATARSTSERITTDYLRASGNAIGTARDYRHAFCNYTYYRNYDWAEYLSEPIPEEGLSYYGGKKQNKKQFFATYTVDEQAFSRLYYMNANNKGSGGNNSWDDAYIGKGSSSTNGYTLTGSREFTTQVKTDENDTYRWFFTGDPYDMQIHCVGVGELNSDYALALKNLWSTGQPTEGDGTAAVLTADLKEGDSDSESYGQFSHFEIIQRSSGQYVLWSIDTDNRYDYCLTNYFKNYNGAIHLAQAESNINMNTREWMLVDVFNHYTITWHVMENQGTTGEPSYTDVASTGVVYDENTVLQVEDLPEELRRHFCLYSEMYSDDDCTAALPNNALTVTASTSIYVPYTLDSGAPDFLSETPTSETAEKYWYEIHYPGLDKVIYYKNADGTVSNDQLYSSHTIDDVRNLGDDYTPYRWALIGTPYSVKFYNMQTSSYLTTNGSTLSMSATGTTFDLMDDETGEWCAILDAATNMYVNATAGVQRNKSYYSTSAEFTNTYGVVKIAFVLHYSANTLRRSYANGDDTSGTPANGTTETIEIDSYQKMDKDLDDVLPTVWKRAFCKYTYDWGTESTESTSSGTTVTNVTQEMVDAYNANKDEYLYVHVTYDYETDSPFQWSTADATWENKHWYYLVNNHIQGTERGKMVYRDSGPKLRVSQGLVDDRQYLYNFEWCVIGDPYGFKMLNHYDPDLLFSQYISVTGDNDSAGEGKQIEQQSGNTQCLFEMMPGRYSYNFWMHPIYDYDLMGDEYDDNSYSYVGHNYNGSAAIIPNNKYNSTYLHNNAAANLRLEMRTNATLKEYLDYAGFVGSIKTSVVPDGLAEKIANGTATDEELKNLHNLIDDPSNLIQMKQGYYRIIPYVYEKGKISGEEAHRRYVRGYHYGSGTNGYTDEGVSTTSYGYSDRFEYETGGSHNKRLMANETPEKAAYDPASIFHFEAPTEDGHPRYLVTTQGLNLSGHSLSTDAAFETRYEDIGAVTCQLKTVEGDPTNAANYLYLSWQQNSTNNEPADYRRMALRNCFEMYGFTRLYLQPVGDGSAEMPLKLEMYPGKHTPEGSSEAQDYYFASINVPYDLVLPDGDVYAYAGKLIKNNGKDDEKDWRLQCEKLSAQTIGGVTYEKGKFIPAGTPALIRATATEGTVNAAGLVNDYDYDHRNTDSGFITLTIPNDAPAGITPDASNIFKGQYLEQVLSGTKGTDVPDDDESVYIFGQATGNDYATIPDDDNRTQEGGSHPKLEAGFYINKNTPDGSADISKKNNLYVRHNKIYLFEKTDEANYTSSKHYPGGGSAPQFIALDFGETGIEELGRVGQTVPRAGVFDMQGRCVASAEEVADGSWRRKVAAGVYVVNGRKLVVR